ncbi:PaaI family thioesterase [Pectinatus sottacetonis]|uniref:PaaI family thioesterase n=1 Tax=Pectinatus sottacetonis TaxID=1002795 RepID=UPI0018C46ECD|nr:PaaI family thioesterase [Pectinatus sottacetonis]
MIRSNLHLDDCTLNEAIKSFYNDNTFTKNLGIISDKVDDNTTVTKLDIKHCHTNVYNIAHGGVMMSLADTAIGAACLRLNKRVVTLDFNINMLKAVPQGDTITAKTQVIHNGKQTIVVECAISDNTDRLCCKSRATMFVLGEFQK